MSEPTTTPKPGRKPVQSPETAVGVLPEPVQDTARRIHPGMMPYWQPGQTGNPRGRPRGGASIVQWCGVFMEEPKYGGPTGLLAIAYEARHGETQAKQIAARRVLRARRMRWSRSGTPLAHADLEGILDRDLGKPKQQVELETRVVSVADTTAELGAIHEADPRLVLDVIAAMVERIPGLRLALLERLSPALPAGDASPPGPAVGGGGNPPPVSSLA